MDKKLVFETIGNIELLSHKRIAVFCSQSFPQVAEQAALDLIESLSHIPLVLAGGWQAPFEKKIYKKLSRVNSSVHFIHYLAKDINSYQLNPEEQNLVNENRLLLIAPRLNFSRADAKQVSMRDRLLFEQNNKILFLGLSAGGRLEGYIADLSSANYQLYILDHPLNEKWFAEDLLPLNPENVDLLLHS